MRADDPRHGTEAGAAQHERDGEAPCDPCRHADNIAARRRAKRKAMGYVYTREIGQLLHDHLMSLRAEGVTQAEIAAWAGISPSQVHRILKGGPRGRVLARTWHRLVNMRPSSRVTPIGVTRRIQALQVLGWSIPQIAAEAGVSHDTVLDASKGPREFLAKKVTVGISAAYERMSMRMPPAEKRYEKAGSTRVRNAARKKGWLPPLSWNSIDDPTERGHRPERRAERRRLADEVDPAVVNRLLGGETGVDSTRAEKEEVIRIWTARGGSEREMCFRMGWKSGRYNTRKEPAA